jgi:hypothetical protein
MEERRALDFFRRHTAHQFPGYFPDSFWNCLLQLSHSEPAIRHAIVAVGSMHEQYEIFGMASDALAESLPGSTHRFGVLEYNKATSSLVKRLSSDPNSILVTVAACLLFISIEFLRGEIDLGLNHLHSGLNILKTWRDGPESPSESSMVEEELLPVFERLSMVSSLFGRPAYQLYGAKGETPSVDVTFDSLSGARKSLVTLVNLSLQFIYSVLPRKNRFEVTFEDVVQQYHLENLLRQWERSFKTLSMEKQWIQLEQRSVSVLLIQQTCILIWLLTSLSPNETSYDEHKVLFESVINLASVRLTDAFADPYARDRLPSTFSFEMQLIAPLYFVAIKCRVGWIRRKAIALLYKMSRKEGPWDSGRSAKVAERVMDLEERGLDPLVEEDLPPEWPRIHHAEIKCDKHPVTGQQLVEFLSKPNGLHGEWKVYQEYMILEGHN